MGISRIFDLSSRSLSVYQQALDATAHNISNSSNPDYSRQVVRFRSESPEVRGGMIWGTGIKLDQAQRVRNNLIDAQIRTNNQKNAESSSRNATLGQIEELFSEPSDLGLSNLMNGFFNSWQEASVTPNSIPLRYNIVNKAENIASKVQNIYESLNLQKTDILNEIKTKVSTLNNKLSEVQNLNAQIFQFKIAGQTANDLLDQRDKAIDDLSKMANINVTIDSNNSAVVSVGGVFAADQSNVTKFKIAENNGKIALVTESGDTQSVLNSGDLFALTDIYSNDIPKYQASIDTLFTAFTEQVNKAHKLGYTLGTPPETSIDFFEGYQNGVLKINSSIKSDPTKIALSADGMGGNGDIAIKIAELASNGKIGGSTFNDYYSSMVSEIGNSKILADQNTEATGMVLEQLQTQRASYSGVSVDEEMTNIIKFQKSYEASAKMIKVADELLQTLLNLVG